MKHNSDFIEQHEVLAKKIWDYCNISSPLSFSDAIIVLCSHDIRIAKYAADLFQQGLAPLLIFSGGLNAFTSKIFSSSEAEAFAQIARESNVTSSAILVETKSTNTQENLEFTLDLLSENDRSLSSAILVQMPSMLRRVYATATRLVPNLKISVTSHNITFEQAPHDFVNREMLIHQLVGDLQRIEVYGDRGMMVPQEIDPEVWNAYLELRALGYVGN